MQRATSAQPADYSCRYPGCAGAADTLIQQEGNA